MASLNRKPAETLSDLIVEINAVLKNLPFRAHRIPREGRVSIETWQHLDRQFAAIEAIAHHARRSCARALADDTVLDLPRTKQGLADYAEMLGIHVTYPIDYTDLKEFVMDEIKERRIAGQKVPEVKW